MKRLLHFALRAMWCSWDGHSWRWHNRTDKLGNWSPDWRACRRCTYTESYSDGMFHSWNPPSGVLHLPSGSVGELVPESPVSAAADSSNPDKVVAVL